MSEPHEREEWRRRLGIIRTDHWWEVAVSALLNDVERLEVRRGELEAALEECRALLDHKGMLTRGHRERIAKALEVKDV